MFRLSNILLPFLVALLMAACSQGEKADLRAYYFPLESLSSGGMVYCYESTINEQDPPFYWHYQSIRENGKTYLLGTYYDYRFRPFQSIREEALYNGMILREYKIYEYDSLGRQYEIAVQIEGGSVFPFSSKDSLGVLYTKLHWQSPLDTTYTTTLIRNRQYAADTTWQFNKQTHQALNFYVRELIDVESEGHIEQEYDGQETYARHIGLVFFQKNISADFRIAYQLTRIISPEEFAELQKK